METEVGMLKEINPFYFLLLLPLVYLILKSPRNLPPGPVPWPIIGNILSLGKKPHVSLTQLAASYGSLMCLRLGTQLLVVASSPDAAAEILKTNDKILSARAAPHAVPVYPDRMHLSMAWSDCTGQWKFLRSLVKTDLFSNKMIEDQAKIRELKVIEMVEFLRTKEGETELFIAGTDTTTSTVEWALSELLKNPEAMEKVLIELNREIKGTVVKDHDLPSLRYLHCVVKEVLRLYPAAPLLIPHRASETCKVMNYTIPKDAQIFVNVWAIGRDPKIWEDPLSFKPERFLETGLELYPSDFKFLPFGSGRRICPGLPMASKQVALILASLLNCFEWSLPHGMHPSELDMEENFSISLQKQKPLVLIPKIKNHGP